MIKFISSLILLTCFLLSSSGIRAAVFTRNSENPMKPTGLNSHRYLILPETGKTIYQKYCLTCHQMDASGVPAMYPPLQKSNWVIGDKNKLIRVILNGLAEEIEVDGETYNGTMPKQDNLTDNQIALVLTYLRQNFGNEASAVKPNEVKKIRGNKISKTK